MENYVYKIETKSNWDKDQDTGFYFGSTLDKNDGFIHLSNREQTAQTLALYFADIKDLIIIEIDCNILGEKLKWEESRGGALFPHFYDNLPRSAVVNIYNVVYKDNIAEIPVELRA
jgi:uncharacterized protein (DUF952 family)